MAGLMTRYLSLDSSLRNLDIGTYDVNRSDKSPVDQPNYQHIGVDLAERPAANVTLTSPYHLLFPEVYASLTISGLAFKHVLPSPDLLPPQQRQQLSLASDEAAAVCSPAAE